MMRTSGYVSADCAARPSSSCDKQQALVSVSLRAPILKQARRCVRPCHQTSSNSAAVHLPQLASETYAHESSFIFFWLAVDYHLGNKGLCMSMSTVHLIRAHVGARSCGSYRCCASTGRPCSPLKWPPRALQRRPKRASCSRPTCAGSSRRPLWCPPWPLRAHRPR